MVQPLSPLQWVLLPPKSTRWGRGGASELWEHGVVSAALVSTTMLELLGRLQAQPACCHLPVLMEDSCTA